ncbi:helix-turn-helix domain-containing protein [Leclercia sp. Marseille-Q4284]|jgi:DNA-binding XRE family transcriptional regulator|uniref:helix-turn-helix domain-containing protein n=1 Tax=Leclercia sp. Marseille-Q4284 TaxID=2866582 RepID=UPI001CE48192|nr:helix-turn-helix transcriptional regulator [Leclercia sp. Marseille-Q4284]
MKRTQKNLLSTDLSRQLSDLGYVLAQSRIARKIPQSDVAVRANISRNTISRIENGDAGVAIGQILRYLDVVRPGATLADVMMKEDNAVLAVENLRRPRRARPLSDKELEEYDF